MKFLYAAGSVKSNNRVQDVVAMYRIVTLAILFLGATALAQNAPPLAVVEDSLPALDAGIEAHIALHARGGVPPYHWRVASGDLPEGVQLTPEGVLTGRPGKSGFFPFTVTVEDSGHPAHSINKDLRAEVTASLVLEWLRAPAVRGDRIDGVAQVSNGSRDDFDLTFIVVGVNDIGRATALGYQHVKLKAGTANLQVPFGSTLPRGAYVVHADAVAEIPAKKTILRRQLETPVPLPVTQGP
jgi:hypothetical protein